jgi:serine/threonine-protein kinase
VTGHHPSPALVAGIGIEVLRALEAAHENMLMEPDGSMRAAPIIHRDISPSNVMLSIRGVVKLADFGLARALHQAGVGSLTPAGVVKGKLAYMAPEILKGRPVSPQSDVYSCGVMLWEMLARQRMFASEKEMLTSLLKGVRARAVREIRADVPAALGAAIDRALAHDPAERYASAAEFARALSDVLRTVSERTDRSRLATEFTRATTAWRQRQAAERGGTNADGASESIHFDVSAAALAAAPGAPAAERSESIYFDVSAAAPVPLPPVDASDAIEVELSLSDYVPSESIPEIDAEYLPDPLHDPDEASALMVLPLLQRTDGARPRPPAVPKKNR